MGLHERAVSNREIFKKVRCHLILINLGGYAPQQHTSVWGGGADEPGTVSCRGVFVLASQFYSQYVLVQSVWTHIHVPPVE